MVYGRIHRRLLQSVISRGVMVVADAEQLVISNTGEEEPSSVTDLVKKINDEIRPFQQTIKITTDELTNEEVLIFLSLGCDAATQAQTVFSATELEYFRILIEEIMTTEARQITGIHAINLVGGMKSSFTKTDAQKLLNTWCRMRYLDKDQNNYALGVRAIHEFEGYFRENMPDTVQDCCLCKQNVFRGYNCPLCGIAIHNRCLTKYLERIHKWPCCKADFSSSQLEQMQCAESMLVQHTQRSSLNETELVDQTQQSEDDQGTQEIIPEISQRVSRKRNRPD